MKRLSIPNIVGLIVVVLLISLVCVEMQDQSISRHDLLEDDTSRSNLKEIGLGLLEYKKDHHGQLPASWETVMPYLGGAKYLLKSAYSSENPCYTCTFRENLKDNEPLCWMSTPHKHYGFLFGEPEDEYRFVLYGDGHVKRLKETEFEQLTLPPKKFTF